MSHRQFSIIVCTHNRAALLPELIGRLRAQDYPQDDFEIIIVDNNSTDETALVVQRITAQPGASVRYVFDAGTEISAVRNRGAEESRFEYLAYLDDDCLVEPDWLARISAGFDLKDNVAVVGGQVILDWSQNERPTWIGSGLDSWLGSNENLGLESMILDEDTHILEGNMAVRRENWKSSGGFLGMELFGSRNMASGEVLYMLHRVMAQGGLIAFAPQAVALHRMGTYTRRRFIQRGYWQGVSTGILDHLLYQPSLLSTLGQIVVDASAAGILFFRSLFHFIFMDEANGMCYLVRAARRFSLVLTAMRLTGDWTHINTWIKTNHPDM